MNATRKITEGAMISAIVGVMLYLNRESAGIIDFALFWIIPTPIVLYSARYGIKNTMLPISTILVLSLIISLPQSIFYVVMALVVALCYGYGLQKQFENYQLLICSCVISLLTSLLTTVVFATFFGYNLVEEFNTMAKTIQEVASFFNITVFSGMWETIVPSLLIASLVFSGLLEGMLIHFLTMAVLRRFKVSLKPMKYINEIKLPKKLTQGLLFGMMLVIVAFPFTSNLFFYNVLMFFYLMLVIVFLINGYLCMLTILVYYRKRNYIFLVLLLFPLLVLVGVLDGLYEIRTLFTTKYHSKIRYK